MALLRGAGDDQGLHGEQGPTARPGCGASRIQAAVDEVALGLLDDDARQCVDGAATQLKDERTAERMAAVSRLMRRA